MPRRRRRDRLGRAVKLLNRPRVSRIWRIRQHSAITQEIPPRSVRTYNNDDDDDDG